MNLLDEIRYDLDFIRSHNLQPRWYKVFKVFIVVGFLAGYGAWFGLAKTIVFFSVFITLGLIVHMLYRVKTDRFRQSWLDFVVVEGDNGPKAVSIGRFYYSAVVFNTVVSLVLSQVLA